MNEAMEKQAELELGEHGIVFKRGWQAAVSHLAELSKDVEAAIDAEILKFMQAIEHGDAAHRAWLYEIASPLAKKLVRFHASLTNAAHAEEIGKLKYNYDLRVKEIDEIVNNADESRWVYWRKRAGKMTDLWRDRRDKVQSLEAEIAGKDARIAELDAKLESINTPEIKDFISSVENEAKHQRLRWGSSNDSGKTDADWFFLIGYLGGKAIHAQNEEKKLHHIITTAAACLNWHAAKIGVYTDMRPGIDSSELTPEVKK